MEEPEALGLPSDAYAHVLAFNDGSALLSLLAVARPAAALRCSRLWREVRSREFPDFAAPAPQEDSPASYRLGRALATGVVVVEFGETGERVGFHRRDRPRRVATAWTEAAAAEREARFAGGAARRRVPRPFANASDAAARVEAALAAMGVAALAGAALLVVAPPFASRASAARVLAELLRRGCARARVEHAAICAAVSGADRDLPLDALLAKAGRVVVLDVGATSARAVPVANGRVPAAVLADALNVRDHAHTRLTSRRGGDAASSALARAAPALAPTLAAADALKQNVAYVRARSPASSGISGEELAFAAVAIGGVALAAERFAAGEALLERSPPRAPAPRIVTAPSDGSPVAPASDREDPDLGALCERAADAMAGRGPCAGVVLAGGGCAMSGFATRLKRELLGGAGGRRWAAGFYVSPEKDAADRTWAGAARLAAHDARWVTPPPAPGHKRGSPGPDWLADDIARRLAHF